ncbi:MAG: IgGFc-binding protein, partial [Myxococcales bacterium]|nr:IgGFc-binding protein [Myxococcales bacterium]
DEPLLVVGLLGGQDLVQADSPFGTRAGDPSLFLVPPDRQLRRDYAFLVPGTYALDFLTVVAAADTALALDGEPVDLAGAAPIPGTARVFLHLPLGDGGHRVTGDGPFAIRVTAFDDFVSYALTGGLDLRKP